VCFFSPQKLISLKIKIIGKKNQKNHLSCKCFFYARFHTVLNFFWKKEYCVRRILFFKNKLILGQVCHISIPLGMLAEQKLEGKRKRKPYSSPKKNLSFLKKNMGILHQYFDQQLRGSLPMLNITQMMSWKFEGFQTLMWSYIPIW